MTHIKEEAGVKRDYREEGTEVYLEKCHIKVFPC